MSSDAPHTPVSDAEFADLLAQYDEALGASTTGDPASTEPESLLQDPRLEGAFETLRLLHRCWPRRPAAPAWLAADATAPALFGRFVLEEVLGRGGFGVVFRALDPILQRHVALKTPRPEVLASRDAHRRFLREGQTAARLHHPNLVTVLEAGAVGPTCYLATEYCPGSSLAEWRKSHPQPLAPRLAARLIGELADAAGYLHAQGIVHRDIKPGNVLLCELAASGLDREREGFPYRPRLTDFGLAKSAVGESLHTRTGVPLGTPSYMAPEQASGAAPHVGPTADVYSLGVILYELLAGTNLFAAASDLETYRRHLEFVPPSLHKGRGVPSDLAAICDKCLEKDPAQRYANGTALGADLERFLSDQRPQAAPPWPWTKSGRPSSLVLGAALFAAGLALAGGWFWFTAGSRALVDRPPTASSSAAASSVPDVAVAPGQGQPAPVPPPAGLIAWWSGDGHARDLLGGHDGTLVNGATFAPGRVGEAFFLDGALDATEWTDQRHTVYPSSTDLLIGGYLNVGGIDGLFHGLIDEIALYDRALEEQELHAIYRAGSAGKRKPPAARQSSADPDSRLMNRTPMSKNP